MPCCCPETCQTCFGNTFPNFLNVTASGSLTFWDPYASCPNSVEFTVNTASFSTSLSVPRQPAQVPGLGGTGCARYSTVFPVSISCAGLPSYPTYVGNASLVLVSIRLAFVGNQCVFAAYMQHSVNLNATCLSSDFARTDSNTTSGACGRLSTPAAAATLITGLPASVSPPPPGLAGVNWTAASPPPLGSPVNYNSFPAVNWEWQNVASTLRVGNAEITAGQYSLQVVGAQF